MFVCVCVCVCVQLASSESLQILGVLETHFHADFVSGHCEMAKRTGATIYFGPSAKDRCKFPMHEVKDNEVGEMKQEADLKTTNKVKINKVDLNGEHVPPWTQSIWILNFNGLKDIINEVILGLNNYNNSKFSRFQQLIKTLPDDSTSGQSLAVRTEKI